MQDFDGHLCFSDRETSSQDKYKMEPIPSLCTISLHCKELITFTLPPELYAPIALAHGIRDSEGHPSVQVQLHFCAAYVSGKNQCCIPDRVCLKVNGTVCPLPRVLGPVDITPFIQTMENTIVAVWRAELIRNFSVKVGLAKTKDTDCLKWKSADYTRALICQKLAQHDKSAVTQLNVPLSCPLTKTKMKIPCRALSCSHVQCFDGPALLEKCDNRSSLKCPHCHRPITMEELFVDGYFHEICTATKDDETVITLFSDGSWEVAEETTDDQL